MAQPPALEWVDRFGAESLSVRAGVDVGWTWGGHGPDATLLDFPMHKHFVNLTFIVLTEI